MKLDLVLITGMSGSGKSVALHALEDAGFYCVDNLPPELLKSFAKLEVLEKEQKVAIAMDVRSADALHLVPAQLTELREMNINIRLLFLECSSAILVHRYSETRRRHPLSSKIHESADQRKDLIQAIDLERNLLADLREHSHIIDTSLLRSVQLQGFIKSLITAAPSQLTLMFESFAFKRGLPVHADYVFDVRMLPNPHYEQPLKSLTGRDLPVAEWLQNQNTVQQMENDITRFLNAWLPKLEQDHRSYVTVAIGCTGGQHRSVYLVEQLSARFSEKWVTLKRHRELDDVTPAMSELVQASQVPNMPAD
jgi:UPF0042 nucleotide-binding protein